MFWPVAFSVDGPQNFGTQIIMKKEPSNHVQYRADWPTNLGELVAKIYQQ